MESNDRHRRGGQLHYATTRKQPQGTMAAQDSAIHSAKL